MGTGTGWTAALLSHLAGEDGAVTSIEVDAAVAEQAAKNLAVTSVPVRLLVGDGALGCADGASYDRVHVTCAVHTVLIRRWPTEEVHGRKPAHRRCRGDEAD
ncbi:Protein-L-isoaspartate(D-aspartate) O-methyltransferase (PCMT) [Nonomuraea jiangxiensis]|uniref:Protein-L-isoaspartate O-methyltransferase n=1 Tax=Nonomuraea jiangxiensis TaxID=633440 RepID=A0A1G7Z202_9ACTN|nr:methyltransferase domain-containing protein [Nonomuraea jiangxiensis]SDH02674.1 Protein-L-isoaspartate(D-aspartate) O-methyltransferase (PCMT) [Nonomuraea jiangxiensis]